MKTLEYDTCVGKEVCLFVDKEFPVHKNRSEFRSGNRGVHLVMHGLADARLG